MRPEPSAHESGARSAEATPSACAPAVRQPKSWLRGAAQCAPAALLVAVFACSTTTTETSTWKSPSYAGGPLKSVVVFAGRVDGTESRMLEDGFVARLRTDGVRATPAYALFPQDAVPKDPAEIRSKLQNAGYDGALVSTLKGVTERTLIAPDALWNDGFYGAYWGPGEPVYAETDRFVKFETSLWSAISGQMLWSTITETDNPRSGNDFVSSLTSNVVPSLTKAGLIGW